MTDKPIFDFENSQVPQLKALENSYTNNELEEGIKSIFIDLFKSQIGEDAFNTFVSGVPHLGSYPLVQKYLNDDGLALLDSNMIDTATRYLLRAWKSGDVQKRGLHIAKLYLQLLFGDSAEAIQLQQPIDAPYPSGLENYKPEDGLIDGYFLTSRVNLDIDFSHSGSPIKRLTNNIQSVLPARFVPDLRFSNISTKFDIDFKFIHGGKFDSYLNGWGYLIQRYFNNPDQSNSNFKFIDDYTMKFHLDGSGELEQREIEPILNNEQEFKAIGKPKLNVFLTGSGTIKSNKDNE